MESALAIAYYLVKKVKDARDKGDKGEKAILTPLKLQKLLYFAQGKYMSKFKEPLFKDTIVAWDYGPVVVSVWREFNKLGIRDIADLPDKEINKHIKTIGEPYKVFLDSFFEEFGGRSARDLVSASHLHPIWQEAHRSTDERITQQKIGEFFESL